MPAKKCTRIEVVGATVEEVQGTIERIARTIETMASGPARYAAGILSRGIGALPDTVPPPTVQAFHGSLVCGIPDICPVFLLNSYRYGVSGVAVDEAART
jgi:hypothetical protein